MEYLLISSQVTQCLEFRMNERIKEMWAKAAELEADPSWEGQTKFIEKFAELVVRECAMLVENQGRYLRYDVMSSKIKDHFEIKK